MKIRFILFVSCICIGVNLFAQYTLNDIPYSFDEINQRDEQGRKQGIWFFYNQYNIVTTMQNYRNDTLQGYFEYYWHTGGVSTKGYYKDGKFDSIMIAYWENGQERSRVYFENGLLNGLVFQHDKNGNLTSQTKYINGKQDSTYTDMYIDPNIVWDNVHPVKLDTIYTQVMKGKYEKYSIYRDDNLVQEYHLEDGIKLTETFFSTEKDYKRIIYCTKKPFGIRKIFYFENHTLIKTELVNDNCKCKKK